MPAAPIMGFSFLPSGRKKFSSRQTERRPPCQKQRPPDPGQNQQGVGPDKLVGGHLSGYGQAQQDGDQVGQHVLGRFAEGRSARRIPQQVAKHEEAHQGNAGGGYQPGNDRDKDGGTGSW